MALEKTVLDENTASELLLLHYGITLVSLQRLKLGSANCYRVFDGTKYYFLKEFQSAFSDDTVVQEAKLLDFLVDTDIPVTRFYKTLSGEYTFRHKDHVICLEKYIDGKSYGYDDLPPEFILPLGAMLGKLHRALKGYSLTFANSDKMSDEWLRSFSAEKMIAQYDELMEIARSKENDENISRIISDLEYKKQLAIKCEEYKKYYNGVTYSVTHGDYQGCQLIFDASESGEIKAVVDFSSAARLPVTWEIMRSFVQSSSECRKSARIDVDALCAYVGEYMKYSELTRKDMISMPYVYLFQLARSKFGYPQYLNSDSEDREGLLDFAFWRTRMCREVENRAEEISNALLSILESV